MTEKMPPETARKFRIMLAQVRAHAKSKKDGKLPPLMARNTSRLLKHARTKDWDAVERTLAKMRKDHY